MNRINFGSAFGREAGLYTLESSGIRASFTDLGAALVSLEAPDREGRQRDVVLGYDSAEGYAAGSSSVGAFVGRYAGRIGGAAFRLGGTEYRLPANDGKNHLHGCFAKRFFDVSEDGDGLVFSLVSPDGEEGFPGELRVQITARLTENALILEYRAKTDRETVLNLTNHSYFDLSCGGGAGAHTLRLFADRYAETGEGLIPTGRLLSVKGTPLDFTEERPVLPALSAPELAKTRGLDHSFPVPGTGLREAARMACPETGIALSCFTTQPTVHVYTAGFFDLDSAPCLKNGVKQKRSGGICLETQHFPDSPNRPEFPSAALKEGEEFYERTEFVFGSF